MKKKKRKKVEKKITFKVDEVCCDTVSLEESQEASHFFFFGCDSKSGGKRGERACNGEEKGREGILMKRVFLGNGGWARFRENEKNSKIIFKKILK